MKALSARVAFRAKVHDRWHPAHGSTIGIHYREKRRGEEVFVCTLQNAGAAVVVPPWMVDRAFCSRLAVGPRCASVVSLRDVQFIRAENRRAKLSGASRTEASEEFDGRTTACVRPFDKLDVADGDCLSDEGKRL